MSAKTASWLDTSAILALFLAEPGYETVRSLIAEAGAGQRTVCLSQISLLEIAASVMREYGEPVAREDLRLLAELPIQVRAPTDADCIAAGFLRAQHRLSTADAIIATQARQLDAELVHKDPEFESVPGLRQHRLPYKPRRR